MLMLIRCFFLVGGTLINFISELLHMEVICFGFILHCRGSEEQ